MKRIFLFPAILIFFFGTSKAQDSLTHNKIHLSFQINKPERDFKVGWFDIDNESYDDHDVWDKSFSLGTTIKYRLDQSLLLRLKTSFTRINLIEKNTRQEMKALQNKWEFAPGFEFGNYSEMHGFFAGFQVPLIIHGAVSTSFENEITTTIIQKQYVIGHIPGGWSTGLSPFMGFRYMFSKTLYAEAEFSAYFLYGQTAGKTTQKNINSHGEEVSHTQDKLDGFFYQANYSMGIGMRLF